MQTSLPSVAARVHASIRPDKPTRGAEVVTRDGRSLPLVSARLRAEAQGGIARIVLEQRFENSYAETLHVTYRMPLPADGAVSGYAFDIADRTITGRIDRKRAAREQFEHAVASGKTAALLEQDRADIFTQSIGNLPASEALIARITIDQKLVWLPEGEWELRFPTVIGPRYIGAADTVADARATAVETRVDGVGARIQIAVKIGDAIIVGRRAASPSHSLLIGDDGVVELRDVAGAKLDRDLVVRWPVADAAVGLALQVARPEHQPHQDDAFGLLTIVPPAREARARPLVRDLIVLVDTSGSMGGGPLDKAKQVVAMLIDSLGDDDRLELIEFSSRPRRYKSDAVPATRGERQAAIRWLRELSADGGTEMRTAVIEAMRSLRPGSQRQVVLATDGYIGGEELIVQQLHNDLPRSCRLHFLGLGSSVNRTLSTSIARAGRGAEVLCDLDEDAERAAKRIIDRTRMPILTNVSIAGSALIEQAPELLPDVFEGSPFVAAVKLRPGELVVRGELAHGVWESRLAVRSCRAGAGNQAIVALFGREHVADLEARAFAGDRNDAEIERTGLAFQIATRFTSWIAIDEARVVTGPARHDNMPQALPYGTTAAAFGLREAAAALQAKAADVRIASSLCVSIFDEIDEVADEPDAEMGRSGAAAMDAGEWPTFGGEPNDVLGKVNADDGPDERDAPSEYGEEVDDEASSAAARTAYSDDDGDGDFSDQRYLSQILGVAAPAQHSDDGGGEFSDQVRELDSSALDELEAFAQSSQIFVPSSQTLVGTTGPTTRTTARYHVPEAVPEPVDEADRSASRDDSSALVTSSRPYAVVSVEHAEQELREPEGRSRVSSKTIMVGVAAPRAEPARLPIARAQGPKQAGGVASSVGVGARRSPMPFVVWLVILALAIAAALWWFVL